MADTLKPCPFCGGEAELIDTHDNWNNTTIFRVNCPNTDCHISCYTGWCYTKKETIEQWNTRKGENNG